MKYNVSYMSPDGDTASYQCASADEAISWLMAHDYKEGSWELHLNDSRLMGQTKHQEINENAD